MVHRKIFLAGQVFLGLCVNAMRAISYVSLGGLFFRLKVEGGEHLNNLRGPCVIIGNHKSHIDPLIMLIPLMRHNMSLLPARVVGADWLVEVPVLGWFLVKILGVFPAQKGKGLDVSLGGPMAYLEKQGVVGIFPEGGIRPRPGVHKFHVGASILAMRANVPVLPTAICGLENCSLRDLFLGKREIVIMIGEPIYIDSHDDISEITKGLREEVAALYCEAQEHYTYIAEQ